MARKKVGKETHPAFRGPAGCPPCPNVRQAVSQTRPCGAHTAKPLFLPVIRATRHDRGIGTCQLLRPSVYVSLFPASLRSPGRPTSPKWHVLSALGRANRQAPGADQRASLSEPAGRVGEARRRRGLSIGDRRQATRPWAVLLCLLSCTSKKVRRPPGRNPANAGSCLNDLTHEFSVESEHHSDLVMQLVSPRRATYFLGAQESRQRSASRRRGPSGSPRCPNARQAVSPTRPFGAQTAKPLFLPVIRATRHDRGIGVCRIAA